MAVAASRIEEAPSDELGAYLATVPRNLSATAWARWRRKNPPPYLQNENRRGRHCSSCAGPLTALLRVCVRCHRRELEELGR